MPIENGLPTQPRRGRAITVRTPGRTSGFMDPNVSAIEDPTLEGDDLLEVDASDEELEELEAEGVQDDSEELEMWMRQTRRAQLLTPEQEVHLAVLVMAKELAEKGKEKELLKLLQRKDITHPVGKHAELNQFIITRVVNEGI